MTDSIVLAIVVAVVGSGSLAFLVGRIFGKVIDRAFNLLGNHMGELKEAAYETRDAVDKLRNTVSEHDKNEAARAERWLETENARVQTCNDTMREVLGRNR
jgi:hypothetical protein